MTQGDLAYFAARAECERMMSGSALDPNVASIHAQLAESYERLAEGLIEQHSASESMPTPSPPAPFDQGADLR